MLSDCYLCVFVKENGFFSKNDINIFVTEIPLSDWLSS
jgi:hypothetical protein